jgi:hypothetical protein
MQSASTSRVRSRSPRVWAGAVAACVALGLAGLPASQSGEGTRGSAFAVAHTELGPTAARLLTASAWTGRTYRTPSGEGVAVYVTDGYLDGDAAGQRWADFFASLVHDDVRIVRRGAPGRVTVTTSVP